MIRVEIKNEHGQLLATKLFPSFAIEGSDDDARTWAHTMKEKLEREGHQGIYTNSYPTGIMR